MCGACFIWFSLHYQYSEKLSCHYHNHFYFFLYPNVFFVMTCISCVRLSVCSLCLITCQAFYICFVKNPIITSNSEVQNGKNQLKKLFPILWNCRIKNVKRYFFLLKTYLLFFQLILISSILIDDEMFPLLYLLHSKNIEYLII